MQGYRRQAFQFLILFARMIHDLAMTLIDRVGPRTAAMLVELFPSAQQALSADHQTLTEAGVSPVVASSIIKNREAALQRAMSIAGQCAQSGVAIIAKGSPHYPTLLAECIDSPHIIYVRGYIDFNRGKWLSVVGTRNATQNGITQTSEVIRDIAQAYPDAVIVSGLAFGIDKAAHLAAMENKLPTVAVMAGWVDDIVPRANYAVARQILHSGGAIISDMPPGTVIQGANFLSRNRLIAGISHGTIVVESAAKGGSLVTADIALSYDRELFALPGRLEDTEHQGTNMLIKSNKATLYQDVSDIAQTMGWVRQTFMKQNPSLLPDYLRQTFEAIADTEPFTLDTLCENMGIGISEASSRIIQLEVRGFVKSIQGRMYQKSKY